MKKKTKLKETYGIIGLGRFGTAVAQRLAESGKEIIVVDKNEAVVKALRDITEYAYVTDNLSQDSLDEIGMSGCGTVVVCIGSEIDISILTVLHLINLGIPRVIAKATSTEHGAVLEKLGAEVIYPERDMGLRLAQRLLTTDFLDVIMVSDDIEISEIAATPKLTGKRIAELTIRRDYGINIIAVRRGDSTNIDIRPDYAIQSGDVLVVIGKKENLRRYWDSIA